MIKRTCTLCLAVFMLLGTAACDRGGNRHATKATSTRPENIADAKLVVGRAICPLEIVNGDSIRASRSFTAGARATLVGWSTVADAREPVPPLVHVVFRSTVSDGSHDLFWPGMRVARPDMSQDNPLLANAGYSASGVFPRNPGKYKVLVWVGDEHVQRECDTKVVFDIHG